MIDVEPQAGELQHYPLPPSLKRRFRYVALMYVVLMSLMLTLGSTLGLNIVPWVIVAIAPAALGVYLARNATITVRVPSDGSRPNQAEIYAELEQTASPFTPQLIGLLVLVGVMIAGTAIIVKQATIPDSPELIEARTTCRAAWEDFEQNEEVTSVRSWTDCLVRNPSLASECGLSGKLASAMLGVESIDDVKLASPDLMACGEAIY